MKLYHATPARNLTKILVSGLKPHLGGIYFADSAKAAAAFILIRGEREVIVFEFDIPDNLVEESFDHNETVLKRIFQVDSCRCFTYSESIKASDINFDTFQTWEID